MMIPHLPFNDGAEVSNNLETDLIGRDLSK